MRASRSTSSERERIVADLGDKNAMILRNHGTLAVGQNVGECFVRLYFLERACQAQIMALSAGDNINNPPQGAPEVAAEQGTVGHRAGRQSARLAGAQAQGVPARPGVRELGVKRSCRHSSVALQFADLSSNTHSFFEIVNTSYGLRVRCPDAAVKAEQPVGIRRAIRSARAMGEMRVRSNTSSARKLLMQPCLAQTPLDWPCITQVLEPVRPSTTTGSFEFGGPSEQARRLICKSSYARSLSMHLPAPTHSSRLGEPWRVAMSLSGVQTVISIPALAPYRLNVSGLGERELVGERGFEPPAPASRRQCSTRLSYSPTDHRA